MKGPSSRVHFLALVNPLILPVFGVKRSLLKPPHLDREPRPKFLQTRLDGWLGRVRFCSLDGCFLFKLIKDITMMPYKQVVALVVKGYYLSAFQVGIVRKE